MKEELKKLPEKPICPTEATGTRGDDRFRGLASAEGQILPFPIHFDGRPYNTLTLPCERVISEWRPSPSWISRKVNFYSKINCGTPFLVRLQNFMQIPGGPKKRPELFVTITARILYGAKFPLAHL